MEPSSAEPVSKLSHTCPTVVPDPDPPGRIIQGFTSPKAAVPRKINGLKLSNVPSVAKFTEPPFGALGLT